MLDLLYSIGDEAIPYLSCIGFATPAVGNAALAEFVRQKGWDKLITNYLVPGNSPSAFVITINMSVNIIAISMLSCVLAEEDL